MKILVEEVLLYLKKNTPLKSKKQIAEFLDIGASAVTNWTDKNSIPDEHLEKIENEFKVNLSEFYILGAGLVSSSVFNDLIPINYYPDVNTAAGYGAVNGDGEPETIMFPSTMLTAMFGIADFKGLDIIHVVGDSMEPIVHHGDTILIRRTHEVRNNQVAVVRIRDEIYIKYYQRDALGRWIRLTSENDIYKAMDFSGKEIEEVVVIGVLIGKFKPF